MIAFRLNGKLVSVDAGGDSRLLWVLREDLKLTGTKFGCGVSASNAAALMIWPD